MQTRGAETPATRPGGLRAVTFGVVALALVAVVTAMGFAACSDTASVAASDSGGGSGDNGGGNGHSDGSTGTDGQHADGGGAPHIDASIFGDSGGACLALGSECSRGGDCCSGTCNDRVCGYPPCVSNGGACASNDQCCTFRCNAGTCAALDGGCLTLGNGCAQNLECCSNRCAGKSCQPSSWCGQEGDICAQNANCCSGNCNLPDGGFGTCGLPPAGAANCGLPDGYLCSGTAPDGGVVTLDGGIPACGGACCSRACAPWGPTGTLICQPASGCRVVGDLCTNDGDCCGSIGLPYGGPKPVTCEKSGGEYGICRNPTGCKPNGDVCKLKSGSCNASCNCCAGNCENEDTCRQDNMGVPRCASPQCVGNGGACATSADCCDGRPCVPNGAGGQPPYVCGGTNCQPACAGCTNTADCCPGWSCGQVTRVCGPCDLDGGQAPLDAGSWDGGIPDGGCSQYGQLCAAAGDCCNGVPCVNGACRYPVP